ncbi:MAG: hypothetical protein IPJ32_08140 [Sphingobacteriaceae bacterium]|nr:hypothetical protein [Sphingobacteriaceae bacterium]
MPKYRVTYKFTKSASIHTLGKLNLQGAAQVLKQTEENIYEGKADLTLEKILNINFEAMGPIGATIKLEINTQRAIPDGADIDGKKKFKVIGKLKPIDPNPIELTLEETSLLYNEDHKI